MNIQWLPNILGLNNPRQVYMPLKSISHILAFRYSNASYSTDNKKFFALYMIKYIYKSYISIIYYKYSNDVGCLVGWLGFMAYQPL